MCTKHHNIFMCSLGRKNGRKGWLYYPIICKITTGLTSFVFSVVGVCILCCFMPCQKLHLCFPVVSYQNQCTHHIIPSLAYLV